MSKLVNNRIRAEYYIVTDPAAIGRHPSNTVVLPGSTISRYHAEIGTADGRFYIEDLGSTYGTYLNDRKVAGRTPLRDGNRITLGVSSDYPSGEYDLTFSTEEVPAKIAASIGTALAKREKAQPGQIAYRMFEDSLVVGLSGSFRGPECDAMVEDVVDRVRSDPRNVVLDLRDVTYMNSYVLGTFIKLKMSLQGLGQESTFACAEGHVLRLLEMVGLSSMFGCHASVEEAVGALQERRCEPQG